MSRMNTLHRTLTRVALLGALAVTAMASTGCGRAKYLCSSKQAEASVTLKVLASSQATYLTDHQRYAKSFEEANFPLENIHYYDFTVDSASATAYSATATGKGDMAGDVWKVDQTGTVAAVNDKCSKL